MENKKISKKVSVKTKQRKEFVRTNVMKLLRNPKSDLKDFHYQLKMLEFNNLGTLSTVKTGVSLTSNAIKDMLKNSGLKNRQQAELLLIAQMEAYRIVNGLINSIQDNFKEKE